MFSFSKRVPVPDYVPYKLEYRHEVGDSQRFRQTTSILMDDPATGRLVGRAIYELEYTTVSASDLGGWDMLFKRTLVSTAGKLTENMTASEREPKQITYRLLPDGRMFDLGHGLPGRQPNFPLEPVGLGDAWNATETGDRPGLPPLAITYSLVVLEPRDGDLQADLVGLAEIGEPHGDQLVNVSTESVVTFSIDRGKVVRSIHKIMLTWPSSTPDTEAPQRRTTQTSIEIEPIG